MISHTNESLPIIEETQVAPIHDQSAASVRNIIWLQEQWANFFSSEYESSTELSEDSFYRKSINLKGPARIIRTKFPLQVLPVTA